MKETDREREIPHFGSRTTSFGCDVVVFLVFNNYTAAQTTNGHKYSGFVEGGPCENTVGRGYAVIVDQGKKNAGPD